MNSFAKLLNFLGIRHAVLLVLAELNQQIQKENIDFVVNDINNCSIFLRFFVTF